ncbi:hypothetical protein [Polyangium aurulentum]|uniref:hypothetical protein n=1 Tax=Polyangium aurulentum TaxID=2567896 RepID=UPI0010AE1363|nr:hypothetical protein [Polyangium aurulentum]UQA62451.1 hypothetical protein E8A73_019125 [Polyangium aurulentum]
MNKWLFLPGVLVAFLGAGCAPPPKVVTQITSARDQIKFLIVQGDQQQVLKCQVAGDGALSNCRPMQLVLQDEE